MPRKKCVYVLLIADWQKSLARITLPLIESFASRMDADLVTITERKFPDWPLVYEKHQVFELGKSYEWNIYVDVDVLLHPALEDFTTWHPSSHVGNWWYRDVRNVFDPSTVPAFAQDGRYYGIIDCFVVTSQATHNLWKPLPGGFEDYRGLFRTPDHWTTVIYSLSRNLAENGYPIGGVLRNNSHMVLLEHQHEGHGSVEERAITKMKEWGIDASLGTPASHSLPPFVFMNVPYGATLATKLKTGFGLDITVLEGDLHEMIRRSESLDHRHVPIIGIPLNIPCDPNNRGLVASLVEKTRQFSQGMSLITSFRHDAHGAFCPVTSLWNLHLMELATQLGTTFIDMDVFIGNRGSRNSVSAGGGLSEEGQGLVADFFIKTVQHKSFASQIPRA